MAIRQNVVLAYCLFAIFAHRSSACFFHFREQIYASSSAVAEKRKIIKIIKD